MQEKLYSTSVDSSKHEQFPPFNPGFQKVFNQTTDLIMQRALLLETGHGEQNVNQISRDLKGQISAVFSLALIGVNPDADEGKRVRASVLPILEAFTKDTDIRSIQCDSYLNLLYTSLHLSRDPSLFRELTISTGFGGSDDSDINIRVPSYVIPGLKTLENLKSLQQRNIIKFDLPTFRIFFAPYSAISINSAEMAAEDVLLNMAKTHDYLSRYITFFHPEILPHVKFEVENPWDIHNEITKGVLDHFSQLLIETQDENIQQSLSILRERGVKHGNESGASHSHVYAAMHPLLFKDGIFHPPVNIFDNAEKNIFALSIGGRPERLFNTIRSYIRKVAKEQNDGHIAESIESSNDIFNKPPDYLSSPVISTLAITKIGNTPVYYKTKYDLGVQTHNEPPTVYLNTMKTYIVDNLSGAERSLELKQLQDIENDINVIIADAKGENALMGFLDSLNAEYNSELT